MADPGSMTERAQLLKDYREMYEYANRLKTFTDWPFTENCTCTPENMAKAGFVHSPTVNEPDVARCFFCLKELEGWEPQDDPWHEHSRRSATCGFLGMKKDFRSLTMEEFCKLELERFKCFIVIHDISLDDILFPLSGLKPGHVGILHRNRASSL